jgi:chlorite dismutase
MPQPEHPRHFLSYGFYTVDPAWRLLPEAVRDEHKAELSDLLERWSERMMVRTFSTVGTRADTELLVWRATPDLDLLQEMQTEFLSTELGCRMRTDYMYTATTKHSQYMKAAREAGFGKPRPLSVTPVDRDYIIVYPFVKKREWYALTDQQRHDAMREHATIGRKYPGIKINTSYSFGIDDQEFMVAFETDSVHDFLDLMMELRGTEASAYTERDVPIFTCRRMGTREALDSLGGVRTAVAALS